MLKLDEVLWVCRTPAAWGHSAPCSEEGEVRGCWAWGWDCWPAGADPPKAAKMFAQSTSFIAMVL